MKFYLTIADQSTGTVLNRDGTYWLRGEPEPQMVFGEYESAVKYAIEYRCAHPGHECLIADDKGSELKVFRSK